MSGYSSATNPGGWRASEKQKAQNTIVGQVILNQLINELFLIRVCGLFFLVIGQLAANSVHGAGGAFEIIEIDLMSWLFNENCLF